MEIDMHIAASLTAGVKPDIRTLLDSLGQDHDEVRVTRKAKITMKGVG